MEKLVQQLIDRLIALESEFDSLPNLSIIQELIKDIEKSKSEYPNQIENIKTIIQTYGNGYINAKSDDLFKRLEDNTSGLKQLINEQLTEQKEKTYLEIKKEFNDLDIKVNSIFEAFKTDLNKRFYKELLDFKQKSDEYQLKIDDMVENALLDIKLKLRDVRNGRDGKDGKNGVGIEGKKGRDGIDGANGANGVGIDDITYKSNTITIFLSNGTKKEIRLNIPISMGGGGISETRVSEMITAAIGSVIDAYTKEESDLLLQQKADKEDTYTKTEIRTSLPKVGFDTTNTTAPNLGQLAWNIDDSTLDLGLNGATLQIGQETLVKVRNSHSSIITNGQVVMAVGTLGNSGRILVNPHTGLRSNAKQIVGIATEDIAVSSDGFVTMFGKVRGINTTGSTVGETWNDGDILYLKPNDNGNLTKIAPQKNEVNMPVALVIHSHTTGVLFVRINGVDENLFYDSIGTIADFEGALI